MSTVLVCTPDVRERLRAVNGKVLPPWHDITTVSDEVLSGATTSVMVVVANGVDDAARYALAERLSELGKPREYYDFHSIEGMESRTAEAVRTRAEDAERKRAWDKSQLKDQRRMSREVDEELVEERREAELDRAASRFDWEDLSVLWDDDPPMPSHLARSDGQCAFYAGQRNLLIGASESGKSWVALMAIRQEVEAGRPCALLDHENGPLIVMDRLRSLGLTREQVKHYVRYSYLGAPLAPALAADLAGKLWAEGGRLAVVDALTPAAHALGLETWGGNTNAVEEMFSICLDPWVQAGHAGVMLDNSPKAAKADTLGSQHKTAGIGGSILAVIAETRFSRHHTGKSTLLTVKDRGGTTGYVLDKDRRLWGELIIGPDPSAPDRVAAHLSPPPLPSAATVTPTVAVVVDIIADTCGLAAEALRRHGVTECKSMRRLAELMNVIYEIDPTAFPHAHLDREDITGCLTKVASTGDHAEAGIGVEVVVTPKTTRYRVWLL